MTRDQDFKMLVRARMRRTGESYTAARVVLTAAAPAEDPDRTKAGRQQQLVERWFDGVRLKAVPARRKVRTAVLLEVLTRFVPRQALTEAEVNQVLRPVHADVAYLRRELVALGYLERQHGTYRVCGAAPARSEQQRRELPAWEQVWLPGFLTSRDPGPRPGVGAR